MIIAFFLILLGITLVSVLGILFSYILFPVCDTIERISYSVVSSATLTTLTGFFLYITGLKDQIVLALALFFLIIILGIIIFYNLKNNKLCKTLYNRDVWLIFIFSIAGTLWRHWFVNSIENFRGSYTYAGVFKKGFVPDLGFYTGLAESHASYIGNSLLKYFLDYFSVNLGALEIFIGVFLYLAFIYLLFINYRKSRGLAYMGVALIFLGPIEIFFNTLSFYGHPLSYIAVFLFFLYFKSENKNIFWLAILMAVYSMITYYTASMVALLSSFGFFLAAILKDWLQKKSLLAAAKNIFQNKKAMGFLIIFMIILAHLIFLSNMKNFTINSSVDSSNLGLSIKTITTPELETIDLKTANVSDYYSRTLYKDPRILGLSAMGWQSLFFLFCGATFILRLIFRKNLSKENFDLILCLIPVTIVSAGFFYMNYPARIFNYFAFFGLLAFTIPKKYYKAFAIISLAFLTATSVCVAENKKIFWENSDKEINAPENISATISGRIFSDQKFVNNLILGGYYNVTGADDDNPLLIGLFYSNDKNLFLESIKALKKGGVKYIATTERMREKYILMLNYPKKNLINSDLYEKNLQKVYDDGDVKIYEINDIEKN